MVKDYSGSTIFPIYFHSLYILVNFLLENIFSIQLFSRRHFAVNFEIIPTYIKKRNRLYLLTMAMWIWMMGTTISGVNNHSCWSKETHMYTCTCKFGQDKKGKVLLIFYSGWYFFISSLFFTTPGKRIRPSNGKHS